MYALGAVLTVLALRARLPWSRSAGVALAGVGTACVAWLVVASPSAASIRTDDERLAALLALAVSLIVCWRAVAARRGARTDIGPTDPDHTTAERLPAAPTVVASGAMLVVVALAALVPPAATSWPPWPLAGLHWLATRVDSWLVIYALPTLVIVGLFAAPAFDTRAPGVSARSGLRRDEVLYFVLFFILLGALPLAIALFGPGALPVMPRPPLSERVWLDLLGAPVPEAWPVREAPGLLLGGALWIGLPLVLPRWRATQGLVERHLKRLGMVRFMLFLWLAVGLLYVPLRVVLGWALGIGPVLALPELGISL